MEYKEQIQHHRDEKDFYFKNHPHSPLTHDDKHKFKNLDYFEIDEKYRFELKIQEFPKKQQLQIQTNTGQIQHYTDFGKVVFIIDDQQAELHIYKTENNPNYYFVPFWDQTVLTKETYGAGRYTELEKSKSNKDMFILDFNLAYNPLCVYSERFSCPLTPPKNRLKIRIEAGEKNFKV